MDPDPLRRPDVNSLLATHRIRQIVAQRRLLKPFSYFVSPNKNIAQHIFIMLTFICNPINSEKSLAICWVPGSTCAHSSTTFSPRSSRLWNWNAPKMDDRVPKHLRRRPVAFKRCRTTRFSCWKIRILISKNHQISRMSKAFTPRPICKLSIQHRWITIIMAIREETAANCPEQVCCKCSMSMNDIYMSRLNGDARLESNRYTVYGFTSY